MKNEILELIKTISDKIGTTAEYLWKILLTQAKISAYVDLANYFFIIIFTIILFIKHKQFSKCVPDRNGLTFYDTKEFLQPIMIICAIIWFLFMTMAIIRIESTITKFSNPEFWALKQLINNN